MASLRLMVRQFKINYINCHLNRLIMTSSTDLNKAIDELQSNPYYDKYAQKIAKLQQTSPEEFLNRIEQKIQKENVDKENKKTKERQFSSVLNPKPDITSNDSQVETKCLEDIMKTELIKDKTPEEITEIWRKYHLSKDVISAVIQKQQFDSIRENIQKYPIFIFPLPRSQGYEFIMCQFSDTTAHFTPLLCYQVHKENAPECLALVHYTELETDKGIILMRGEFDKNVIDTKEAQCLANQLQLYYGQNDEDRLKILNTFTHKPDEFKHMDLIKQLENLQIA